MKFTIENKTIEHTFANTKDNKDGINISWFKSLHKFFKDDYFNNWIHNITVIYFYGNTYPINLTKLFKPLNTELNKIKVVFLFIGEDLNKFSSGIGVGEDRVIRVPDNYLNEELRVFKEACIDYRIDNTTSSDCCSITSDFDQSLNYLREQNVLVLNLNSIKTTNAESTIRLSNYFKPIIAEILDSIILSNENLHIISPLDVELSDYTNLKNCLSKKQIYSYIPKNKDSLINVFKKINESLINNDESNAIVEW